MQDRRMGVLKDILRTGGPSGFQILEQKGSAGAP